MNAKVTPHQRGQITRKTLYTEPFKNFGFSSSENLEDLIKAFSQTSKIKIQIPAKYSLTNSLEKIRIPEAGRTAESISETTDFFDLISFITNVGISRPAAYGVNILDGVFSILMGAIQIRRAVDSKRHNQEKMAWGTANISLGTAISGSEFLTILSAVGLTGVTASAGISLFSGLTFTSGMLLALMFTIREAQKAFKKTEPTYLVLDRLIKYEVISQRLNQLRSKTIKDDQDEKKLCQLSATQKRLKNQAIAVFMCHKEKFNETHQFNDTTIAKYIQQQLKQNITAMPTQQQKKLSDRQSNKQTEKLITATQNIALLSAGTLGIGLLTASLFCPALFAAGVFFTSLTTLLGGFKLAKKFVYDRKKENMALADGRGNIIENHFRHKNKLEKLSWEEKNELYLKLISDPKKIKAYNNANCKNKQKFLNKELSNKVRDDFNRKSLGLNKKANVDQYVSRKEQQKNFKSYAEEKYSIKDTGISFFKDTKNTVGKFASKIFEEASDMTSCLRVYV